MRAIHGTWLALSTPNFHTLKAPVSLPANGWRRYAYAIDFIYGPTGAVELDADPAVELDVVRDVLDP
jgi:hypothetical protein